MELTPENKSHINSLDYRELLRRWRFAPIGDEMFQGETGKYWRQRMTELRQLPGGDELHTQCSKSIGWD
jgi:hypothetical protein